MSNAVAERPFIGLVKDFGIKTSLVFKMADLKFNHEMSKNERYDKNLNVRGVKEEEEVDSNETDFREVKPEETETVVDDGRETNIVVVKREDDSKVIKPKDDVDDIMVDDDKLAENIEDACQNIKGNGKLIDLAITSIMYMASIITPEQLYKRCKNNDDLEVVNSIVKFYSGLSVSVGANCLNINEVISLNLLNEVVGYESKYYNLHFNSTEEPNIIIDEIVEKTRDLMIEASRNNMKMDGIADPDPVIPIRFINKNLAIAHPTTLNKGVLTKLEKEFGDVLCMYAHQFNRLNDLIELMIYSNGRMDQYLIDPGTIIGNGFNVICNAPGNDTVMVNAKHKEILSKVFANAAYVLTPEEMMEVNKDMFMNQAIYHMIDMSKGCEILPKLSEEDFVKLGKKLSFIINLPWNPAVIPAGRLRIRSFKSVDDFVLVSDDKCKSPLPTSNLTNITPELTVKVSGDDVVVKLNDIEQKYHIDEYGIL